MKRCIFLLFLILGSAASLSAWMKVKSEGREGLDLSAYKTYAWLAADDAESGLIAAEGTKLAARLEELGDEKMSEVGLEKSSDGEADLVLRYRAVPLDMMSVENIKQEVAGGVSWVGDPGANSMSSYRQGALLLELLDGETDELLWAGWAQDALEIRASREKVEKKAEKAMRKILKQFPRE